MGSPKNLKIKCSKYHGYNVSPKLTRERAKKRKEKKRNTPKKNKKEKRGEKKTPKKEAGASPPQRTVAVLTKGRGEIGDVIYKDNTPRQNEHSSDKQENWIKIKTSVNEVWKIKSTD